MTLTKTQKENIIEENREFINNYGGNSKDTRKKNGQFFTPASVVIELVEKVSKIEPDQTCLDPCCGTGNLIAGMIFAGANPILCGGIEIDPTIHKIAVERLGKLGVPERNIILGDALNPESSERVKAGILSSAIRFATAYSLNHNEPLVKVLTGHNGRIILRTEEAKRIIKYLNSFGDYYGFSNYKLELN